MDDQRAVRVAIVAVPESYVSCLTGIYDTLDLSNELGPGRARFEVEIVAATDLVESRTSRFPIVPHRTIDAVESADVVILPAALADSWEPGSHPHVLSWITSLHDQGAVICSACSGGLLLAETGLLDGHHATSHWHEAHRFRTHFPDVRLDLTRELIVSGDDQRLVTSGASAAWHDLALYLISRYRGLEAAQAAARFFMLQWHTDGQTPYLRFEPDRRHGDAAILRAQHWIDRHWAEPDVLAGLAAAADLTERTLTRRFRQATGYSPSGYLQHKRVDEAKTLLERTDRSVERICWTVGYDDPASFRRLFKRLTAVTPGAYRNKFAGGST